MTSHEHTDKLKKQAIEDFKNHVIVEQHVGQSGPNRWCIMKPHKDGGYDGVHMAEIIALRGGRLFVGGDIDDVTFAYGDKDPQACVQWIGCCEDVSYYVQQKAKIGLGDGGKLTEDYDPDVARTQLEELIADAKDEETGKASAYREVLKEARNLVDNQHYLNEYIYDNLGDHEMGYLGMVCGARVVYAWAAVRRLCELLGLREEVKNDGSTT